MPFADPNYFKDEFGVAGKQVLLTFGLLSPNKGIEFALRALPDIIREFPNIVYIVLGQTHPNLLRDEGEAYRLSLERLAKDLGVQKHVVFFNRFVELEELMRFIGAADIYLTPYLTEAQITSGTLAYAFGAGNAVVSTPYWHAAELLTAERGKLVPFRDAKAIAVAVVELLRDEPLRHSMRKNAYKLGRDMVWSRVAQLYAKSFEQARQDHSFVGRKSSPIKTLDEQPGQLPELKLDHLFRMSDSTGIFQHASFTVPNFAEGYCTDDNARALALALMLQKLGHGSPQLGAHAATYAAFLNHAFDRQRGRFRNFMSFRAALAGGSRLGGLPGARAVGAGVVRVAGRARAVFKCWRRNSSSRRCPWRPNLPRRAPGPSRSSALTNICGGSAATGARARFANR